MGEAILSILKIMKWLGIILGILVVINVSTGTLYNVWSGYESFSWKRMMKGIFKSIIFFVSAMFMSIAFTMLPFINEMITNTFGMMLIANETLNTLSGVGVLGVVVAAIIVQGKKAIKNVVNLANMSSETEIITWEVEDE